MATILVIDDDPVILEFYRELLTRAGHEVVTAEDGTQGLARSERRPELIVVDMMMPTLNGYDFVSKLRTTDRHRTTPVIAVSGLSTGDWVLLFRRGSFPREASSKPRSHRDDRRASRWRETGGLAKGSDPRNTTFARSRDQLM